MADYDKVGLLAVRDGRILLCRKKHTTSALILPGGCREPGESSLDCLTRELREELDEAFETASDTEVVLRMYRRWGAAMLPRLRSRTQRRRSPRE